MGGRVALMAQGAIMQIISFNSTYNFHGGFYALT